MQQISRRGTGVMLASDVLAHVDRLAIEQNRSRSFIINQMLREAIRLLRLQSEQATPVTNEANALPAWEAPKPKEIAF